MTRNVSSRETNLDDRPNPEYRTRDVTMSVPVEFRQCYAMPSARLISRVVLITGISRHTLFRRLKQIHAEFQRTGFMRAPQELGRARSRSR